MKEAAQKQERCDPAPLFAFRLTETSATLIDTLPDPMCLRDRPSESSGFVWVHLDLAQPGVTEWLGLLPVGKDIVAAISRPVPRGRLFTEGDLLFGQLRDVRREDEGEPGHARHGGALSVLIGPGLVVTGRIKPLAVVDELRQRLEATPSHGIATPFAWLTAFFGTLNSIGEHAIDETSAALLTFEIDLLRGETLTRRDEVLAMRRRTMILTHDLAYRRTSMLGFLEAQLPLASQAESRALKREVDRYAALLADMQEVGDRCNFLLEEMRTQVEASTNRNLQVLTIFSVLIIPATVLTGLWGMNVARVPFDDNAHGFWIILALIGAAVLAMLVWLRSIRIL